MVTYFYDFHTGLTTHLEKQSGVCCINGYESQRETNTLVLKLSYPTLLSFGLAYQ